MRHNDNELIWESLQNRSDKELEKEKQDLDNQDQQHFRVPLDKKKQDIEDEQKSRETVEEKYDGEPLELMIENMMELYRRFPEGYESQDKDFEEVMYNFKRQLNEFTDELDTKLYNMGADRR